MKLREPIIKHINNVTEVEGKTINGETQAARAGFKAGAQEMARLVQERVKANDLRGLVELMSATQTKSFYGE